MAGATTVRLQRVEMDYADKRRVTRALEPTDLVIGERRFVVLLGPSGCGKTTLLRMMGGLLAPSGGTVSFGDMPLYAPGAHRTATAVLGRLGFVFQDANLLPWRNVWRNIVLPLEGDALSRRERREVGFRLAAAVGLAGFEEHLPRELSGGMKQRVALARALSRNPSLLLMDEPFGALDAITREQMNLLVQQLWLDDPKTTVLVTHSIAEAVFLADDVIVMAGRPGRVVDSITVPFARPRTLDMMQTREFVDLVGRMRRGLLNEESRT